MNNDRQTILELFAVYGPMVPKCVAGRIADLSPSAITQRIEAGDLREITIPGQKGGLIPLSDAVKLQPQHKKRNKRDGA